MNLFVISDLHAHTAWPFSRPLPSGRPSRFQELLTVLTQVEHELEQRGVEDLIIGGDLTHRRHFLTWTLYNPLYDALKRLAERVRQTIILAGNHDYETSADHGIHVLRGLPNTLVIDQPGVVTLADGETGLFALPYLEDPEAALRAVERAPALPFIAHYGAEGCEVNDAYYLEAPLKVGELAKFPWTIFGHIHKPSTQLGGRVQYVGAVQSFDFGDAGPRGALHVTGDGRPAEMERVWLTSPEFVTAAWPRTPFPPAAGGYLRQLEVPAESLVEAKETALKMGWLDCLPVARQLPEAAREAVLGGLVVDEAMLRAYVARKCPTLEVEEQAALVRVGMELMTLARK